MFSFVLFFAEFGMFVRGEKCDVCGICVALFAICIIGTGTTWAPLGIYLEWDPIFLVVNSHFPRIFQHKWSAVIVWVIRFCWSHWCILEASRLYVLVLMPTLIVGNSYLAIVSDSKKYALGNRLIHLYSMLHCANQIGQAPFATLIGLLMVSGIIMLVTLNSVIITSWSALPIGVYILCVNIAVIAYFAIFQTIPVLVKSNELCLSMLESWSNSIYKMRGFRLYWAKKVRAQRAVAFHYGFTKFEQSTKRNYYSTIVDKTISVVLF